MFFRVSSVNAVFRFCDTSQSFSRCFRLLVSAVEGIINFIQLIPNGRIGNPKNPLHFGEITACRQENLDEGGLFV